MAALLSLDSVVNSLRSLIPDAEWLLSHMESAQGWIRFPAFLANTITNLKIHNYPLLYSSERAIFAVFLRGFMSDDEIRELSSNLEAASIDERGMFLTEMLNQVGELLGSIEIPKTPEEQEAARQAFLALPEEDQQEVIRVGQHFFSFYFASFFQSLSVMVHGEKLTSLVAQAVAGSDTAFVKAVQIDRRILTEYPYFSDRFARAQLEGDSDFYGLVSYRINSAPYRGKIRYKSLWLALSVLEATGWLNELKHREILEICDEAGVGGWENRIQEVKYLSKRLQEYHEFQRRGFVTTH